MVAVHASPWFVAVMRVHRVDSKRREDRNEECSPHFDNSKVASKGSDSLWTSSKTTVSGVLTSNPPVC